METTSPAIKNTNYSNTQNKDRNPWKIWVIILGVLAGIFLCTTIYFAFFGKPTTNVVYKEVEAQNLELQTELDSLMDEHEKIKEQYGTLSDQLSEQDSIIMANAAEIEKLINTQADYNRIKRQLKRLQKISQDYVVEMDKLYEENKALKEENTQVKADLEQERQEKEIVQKSNEDLTEKISTAAVYKAYNIKSYGMHVKNNGEELETDKANRVDIIRTNFILGENSLLEAAPVNVYCRIAVPGPGKILKMGTTDAFSFVHDGQKLQYSCKKTINYEGQSQNVSLDWNVLSDDHAIKGKYIIQIFTDEQYLGETYFTLK